MPRLTFAPRWATRTLALLVLLGALAAPLIASPVRSSASQMTHSALALAPRPQCPGSPVGC
ncbi:MAG TPA: hypothetical protein VHR15_21105 [Ktedonobacterales bacterium]|jgi:hypothetical protein|nr:hypothetical protein [Ktedonobacterales bacterium]